ncbi:hypothetical protein EIP86_006990 [Pleurotus ostreatoroseus]|nr:hypothetical protein EIP86_006990 [Pleurotus ostreatoroseus]
MSLASPLSNHQEPEVQEAASSESILHSSTSLIYENLEADNSEAINPIYSLHETGWNSPAGDEELPVALTLRAVSPVHENLEAGNNEIISQFYSLHHALWNDPAGDEEGQSALTPRAVSPVHENLEAGNNEIISQFYSLHYALWNDPAGDEEGQSALTPRAVSPEEDNHTFEGWLPPYPFGRLSDMKHEADLPLLTFDQSHAIPSTSSSLARCDDRSEQPSKVTPQDDPSSSCSSPSSSNDSGHTVPTADALSSSMDASTLSVEGSDASVVQQFNAIDQADKVQRTLTPDKPTYGIVRVIRDQSGQFGMYDPIRWPQVFVPTSEYCWLVAVRRRPQEPPNPDLPIWTPLDAADIELVSDSAGIVCEGFRIMLEPLIDAMNRRVDCFVEQCGNEYLPSSLRTYMVDAFQKLSRPSTPRNLICLVAAVQRFWLLIDAWIEFHVYVIPSLAFREPSQRKRDKVREDLMGAFTDSPKDAQYLVNAGIPIWMISPSSDLSSADVVLDVVQPVQPSFLTDDELPASTPIYSAWAGEYHLRAIMASVSAHVKIKSDPPHSSSESGETREAADREVLRSHVPDVSRRYHPYARNPPTKVSKSPTTSQVSAPKASSVARYKVPKIPPNERNKFQEYDHKRLPPTLEPWRKALASVNRSRKAPIRAHTWLYFVPDAVTLASANDDRFARYLDNWIRTREPWIHALSRHIIPPVAPNKPRALKTQEWRDYLFDATEDTVSKASQRTTAASQLITAVLQLVDVIDPTPEPMWFGVHWDSRCLQQTREVLWELSEIGFRHELLAMDRNLSSHTSAEQAQLLEASRRQLVQRVCANRPDSLDHLPKQNEGLASPNILDRAESLEALRLLLARWPSAPSHIITSKPLTEVDKTTLEKAETSLCKFYVQTFWDRAGRAATIPRIFPVP